MPTAPRRPVFPTAVFLGDSVTTGGRSLSHPRNRWTSLVCEHLRWREVNLAADGMGFFVRRGGHLPGGGRSPSCRDSTWLETAVRADITIFGVTPPTDAAALPSHLDLVRRAVGHDLEFLARRLRGVPVVVAPYFPALDVGPRFAVVRRLIHERATELGLSSSDAATRAVAGDAAKLAADGVHPDDAGHAAIARAMIGVYRRLAPSLCGRGGAPVR